MERMMIMVSLAAVSVVACSSAPIEENQGATQQHEIVDTDPEPCPAGSHHAPGVSRNDCRSLGGTWLSRDCCAPDEAASSEACAANGGCGSNYFQVDSAEAGEDCGNGLYCRRIRADERE